MNVNILATVQQPWWRAVVGGDTAWLCYGVAAGVLAIGLPLLWALIRLHRPGIPPLAGRKAAPLRAGVGEKGTATIEFALVFPILLVLILLLLQVTLLMAGNLFVHYAAFAATRSAIVQIPGETFEEARNVIQPGGSSSKFLAIRRAAATALVPVCGRIDADSGASGGVDPAGYADALRQHFTDGAGEQPGWVDTLAEEKMRYANNNTDIALLIYDESEPDSFWTLLEGHTYGPRDPVTVRVTHRLNLAVPYVRLFFADGDNDTVTGPGGYTIVEAQMTMTNQGIDPNPPDAPDYRRVP